MDQTLRSELVGTAGLSISAGIALLLTILRAPRSAGDDERRRAANVFAVMTLVQALHGAEEYATRFYEAFPTAWGLAPWPAGFFLALNLTWLAISTIAIFGLRAGYRLAFFPAWFLAIVSVANGVVHPLLALRTGGYFPGLVTSPLLAVGGVVLWRKLMTNTEPHTSLRWRDALLLLEAIIFTIVVPGTATIWLPRDVLGLWGDVSRPPWAVWHVAAVVLIAIGFAVYARCVWDFAARGRGIPAPIDHPKQLVVTGLYRYVRNPMYVGVLLVMLGEALFFRSLPLLEYTLICLAIVHTVILVYEEPNLRRKFGSSYDDYAAAVGRWIPGRSYHLIAETEGG
jgi:protein-S-isoprenylcysteine O-methyltransferase Ste14